MIEILTNLLKPKPVVAIVVIGCATAGLVTTALTGTEWGVAVIGAMWWTSPVTNKLQ